MPTASPAPRLPHVSARQLRLLRAVLAVLQRLAPPLAARLALHLFRKPFHRELSAAEAELVHGARRHRVDAGGHDVAVYEWAAADAPTVLVLHGWGSRAGRFAALVTLLRQRGWRVLALDAPGHGESPGRSSDLTQFMTALGAVASRHGPVHALVGHSFGALAIARAHQEGVPAWAAAVRATALVSMPSGIAFLAANFMQQIGIGPQGQQRWRAAFAQRFGDMPEGFAAAPGASRLPGRLLVVHDTGDDIVPFDHATSLVAHLPGRAQLLATRGLGHSGLTRDPATLAAIADFIAGETVP